MLAGTEAIEKRMQELRSAGTEDAALEEVQAHLDQVKQKQQLATKADESQDKPRETHEVHQAILEEELPKISPSRMLVRERNGREYEHREVECDRYDMVSPNARTSCT